MPQDTFVISEVSLARLLDQGLTCLQREMKNLMIMSAHGKLPPPAAKDLRDTVNLIFDLKDREADLLKGLTDEELEQELKKKGQDENNISTDIRIEQPLG